MNKFILSTLLLLTTFSFSLSADESNCTYDANTSYKYVTFGMGPFILIPQVGLGYRAHDLKNGFDASLGLSSLILAHYINGTVNYHYYFNRNLSNPMYAGAGISTGILFANSVKGSLFVIAPDFVIGKEFSDKENNKTFLEAHVEAPLWGGEKRIRMRDRINFPAVFIKYGFSY